MAYPDKEVPSGRVLPFRRGVLELHQESSDARRVVCEVDVGRGEHARNIAIVRVVESNISSVLEIVEGRRLEKRIRLRNIGSQSHAHPSKCRLDETPPPTSGSRRRGALLPKTRVDPRGHPVRLASNRPREKGTSGAAPGSRRRRRRRATARDLRRVPPRDAADPPIFDAEFRPRHGFERTSTG